MGPRLLRIWFDKIDGFIRVCHDEFRHLVLFDYGLFDKICDKIRYLISEKGGITDSINRNFEEIKTDSYNSLPIEKILIFPLREKCPNTEFFLVLIFLYSD